MRAVTGGACLQLTGALAIVLTVGCGSTVPGSSVADRTLRIGLGLPSGWSDTGVRELVANLTTERLFSMSDDGRPLPRLVERWTVTEDRLTWTFTLRPGLKFHDGSAATAGALEEALAPEVARRDAAPGFIDVLAVTAPNERTLVITLRQPSSLLKEIRASSLKDWQAKGWVHCRNRQVN